MAYFFSERHFCIDVECVASGRRHDEKIVALIAVVDEKENVVLRRTVKQTRIYNYLTSLTGLKPGDLDDGVPLEDAIRDVKAIIGRDVVLVGQGIKSDIKWLNLKEGIDYKSFIDLAIMFKTYNPRYNNYSIFSLVHEANTLLSPGFIGDTHDPAIDAIASIRLFNRYHGKPTLLEKAKHTLVTATPTRSWGKKNDYNYEGICMAGYMPKKCRCGAPTLREFD